MKSFLLGILTLTSVAAQAAVSCQDLRDEKVDVKVLREDKVLNADNWKTIDVIVSFSRRDCMDAVTQELVQINGELFWRFLSNDDSCDGGNTYGSLYSYDLKTPLAHVYDGDLTCSENWRAEELAVNHQCDLAAERFAQKKMKDFGLEFEDLSSSLELREGYVYSAIYVTGTLKNKNDRSATVKVPTQIPTCKFGGASIHELHL